MDRPTTRQAEPDHPSRRTPIATCHWKLTGWTDPIARLAMAVQEDTNRSARVTQLKLNSYDLGVDIELQRRRPAAALRASRRSAAWWCTGGARAVFCAGANIHMLASSRARLQGQLLQVHQRDPQLSMEDASSHRAASITSRHSTAPAPAAATSSRWPASEIMLVDDGNSAVSLPETPLLGGACPEPVGLTRLVDKRKVRRDRADVFCTVAEGVKGQPRGQGLAGLVDDWSPRSRLRRRGPGERAAGWRGARRPARPQGVELTPARPDGRRTTGSDYSPRDGRDRPRHPRTATLTL